MFTLKYEYPTIEKIFKLPYFVDTMFPFYEKESLLE